MTTTNNTINATVNSSKIETAKARFCEAMQWLYVQSGCRMVVRKINLAVTEAGKTGDVETLDMNIRLAMDTVPVEGAPAIVLGAWNKVKDVIFSFGDFLKTLGGKLVACLPEFIRTFLQDLGAILGAILNGLKVVWDASKKVIRLVGVGALKIASLFWGTLKKFVNFLKGKFSRKEKMDQAMSDLIDSCMEYEYDDEYENEDFFLDDDEEEEKTTIFGKIKNIFRR